jgi:hypothetical protein
MNFISKIKNIFSLSKKNGNESDNSAEFEFAEGTQIVGVFEESLDDFSEEDIELSERAMAKSGVDFVEIVRKCFFVLFLLIFLASCIFLVQNIISKQRGNDIYNKLEEAFFAGGFDVDAVNGLDSNGSAVRVLVKDLNQRPILSMSDVNSEDEDTVEVSRGYNEELEKMRAGLLSLAQINPDVYGWISIAGTDINYPIVQGKDNDEYLHRTYKRENLFVGSIFMDYQNSADFSDCNSIIYGHNMKDGSMFGKLSRFTSVASIYKNSRYF